MFKVLKIDGPNITTDKGCVGLVPFQYADGGKSRPVSTEDWRAMRALFVAAPDLLAAIERLLDEQPFICDTETCECGEDGAGNGGTCEHVQARRAIAKARGE